MPSRAQPRWSLRALFTTTLTVFGIVALGISVALGWSTTRLHTSLEVVTRDMRSMAITEEIAVALLSHARLSLALDVAPDPEMAEARDELEDALPALVQRARPLASSDQERVLIDVAGREIDAYLATSRQIADRAKTEGPLPGARRPSIERAIAAIDALRSYDEREVDSMLRDAQAVDALSTRVAIAAVVAILIGMTSLAFTLRRSVLHPIGHLRSAIDRYRAGEQDAPIATHGPTEIADVARAFEEMRAALARQRDDRLTFLAGVAHDLRNPLSPLKQGVALLALDGAIADNAPARRTLSLLDRQIDRLNRMISDLLDSARIEAGQLELALAEIDLRDPVRDTVELYRVATTAHEVRLTLPDEPIDVRCDPQRIEQVVSNLLSNAIKYSPRGGPVDVALAIEGDDAVISVRDRGIGIAPDELGTVFTPFRRQREARQVAPGAGLGLSVVRRIVEAHGGAIAVESTLGEGSIFRARLPTSRK